MRVSKLQPDNLTQERIDALKASFPEAFADGKINWDVLRELLGAAIEDEDRPEEHFGLFWPGKREARRLAAQPSHAALHPAPGEGVNEETTRNLFIEGDNLEVLKLLRKAYAGRVKLIYIDPPYNTGNDFIYEDDFTDSTDDYLRKTGQMGEGGELLVSNPKSDGRFHSKWLNMMYPRLVLARELLRDDGVIFVSIDDNEVHHLRLLLNEIFGSENIVAQLTILCNPKGRSQDKYFATNHEYIVAYSKTVLPKGSFEIDKDEDQIADEYPLEDEFGKYRLMELRNTHREFGKHNRKNLWYPLYINTETFEVSTDTDEDSVKVLPKWDDGFEGCWTWDKDKAQNDGDFLIGQLINGSNWKVYRKSYANGASKMLKSILNNKAYHTEKGQKELNTLFNTKSRIFPSPKSVELLKAIFATHLDKDDIVLDFFAGSGTSAQAVLELNSELSLSLKFVLVQIPEPIDSAKYSSIADICKERIRRVIKKVSKNTLSPRVLDPSIGNDFGFITYKLGPSNIEEWNNYDGQSVTHIQDLFSQAEMPLVKNWQVNDVLREIILLEGFPLDSTVIEQKGFEHNHVMLVESDACAHRLFVCLDPQIKADTIAQMALIKRDVFVCLDSALTDETKMQLSDVCRLKVV